MKKITNIEDLKASANRAGKAAQGWIELSTLSVDQLKRLDCQLTARELAGKKSSVIKAKIYPRIDGVSSVYFGDIA